MAPPRPSLDPLRYGVRALDEMARAQASVLVPPRVDDVLFAPHGLLQTAPRDGAALSLRMFSDGADDATAFALRTADTLSLAPPPSRAAPFFEAHAASLAYDGDEATVVGFPLVTFTQSGQRRAAPLVSWGGARLRWRLADGTPWKLPRDARIGAVLDVPASLEILAPDEPDEPDGAAPFTLHAGLWQQLFGLDGDALSALSLAGRAGPAALVRACTAALADPAEDALDGAVFEESPLTRDELRALCDAAVSRAAGRGDVSCHPHAMVMLLPRGDPARALRTELRALLDERAPERGPLAVFLGAVGSPSREEPLTAHGATVPTASQVRAARRFEGAGDLVAVRGPPGCGKTTLLHHLAAQSVVTCALGAPWVRSPEFTESPWSLFVASTNNHAVDHALAPFISTEPGALPVGIRLGNRRVLAEVTARTLECALDALSRDGDRSLAEARADFEHAAKPWRAWQRSMQLRLAERARERTKLEARAAHEAELVARLKRPFTEATADTPSGDELDAAYGHLKEHSEAVLRLAKMYLEGRRADPSRAVARWDDALARRGPKITPVLARLGIEVPFRSLEGDLAAEIERQHVAMVNALASIDLARNGRKRALWQSELDALVAKRESLEAEDRPDDPPCDPSLVALALGVRDAWARQHRATLVPRLTEALAILRDEKRPERGRPLSAMLHGLAPLFPVAGATLLSMRTSLPLEREVIDRLVIDEAGQCAPVYAIPALYRATRAMCTGDVAQLPPVYSIDDRVDGRLAKGLDASAVAPFRMGTSAVTSAQAVSEARAPITVSLVEHFRSQPPIVALASRWSGYALDVRTPPRSLVDRVPWLSRPVLVVPVRGLGDRAPEGIVNDAEARRAVTLVEALVRDGVAPDDVAVLTPFVGQRTRIERALFERGLAGDGGVLVRTVHRLQGGERRVVVFSVTATQRRHLRWLAERPHLLHVATSRAQDHLVVLVDPASARAEPALAPLVEAADEARASRATTVREDLS